MGWDSPSTPSKRAPWSHRWRPATSESPSTHHRRSYKNSPSPLHQHDDDRRSHRASPATPNQNDASLQGELRSNVLSFAHRVKALRAWSASFQRARRQNNAKATAILHWTINTVSSGSPGVSRGSVAILEAVVYGGGLPLIDP